MDANKDSASVPGGECDPVCDTIRFELNDAEVKWLEEQREFFSEALVEILTGAMKEWIARNPDRLIPVESAANILREALDEFISRHKDEFV